jgi:glyoxylase-like metal-dependent hydrolase (beta-lactamase superfamily II)
MTDLLAPVDEGPWTSRALRDGDWVVVAANPGPLTLDGTNSYVLPTPDGCVLVDPGPAIQDHRAALAHRCSDLALVLLTHGHADHSESAFDLADQYEVPVRAADPAWCLRAEPLSDGDRLPLGPEGELVVVATPGHTADSLSFVLRRKGDVLAVLSGDMLLGRGTTFVAHPQGQLVDFLRSLDRLASAVAPTSQVWPGHGPVRHDAAGLVSAYRRHRLDRLDQVRSVWLRGAHTTDEVLEAVYGPLHGTLRAAARASTQAQLAYLGLLHD